MKIIQTTELIAYEKERYERITFQNGEVEWTSVIWDGEIGDELLETLEQEYQKVKKQ